MTLALDKVVTLIANRDLVQCMQEAFLRLFGNGDVMFITDMELCQRQRSLLDHP